MPLSHLLTACLLTATLSLSNPSSATTERISPLPTAPVIDGKRDGAFADLPRYQFPATFTFDNQFQTLYDVTYSLGYHKNGLYILVETNDLAVRYHRRGFLYGDGLKVMIGPSRLANRSDDFIELSFSPTLDPDYKRLERYISSYNGDGRARRVSRGTQIAAAAGTESGTGFEILIAWEDIYPYHPGFTDQLNLNIYFAKGMTSPDGERVTKGYALSPDEGIWDEAVRYRRFKSFPVTATQQLGQDKDTYFQVKQRTIMAGETLRLLPISTDSFGQAWMITQNEKEILSGTLSQKTLVPKTLAQEPHSGQQYIHDLPTSTLVPGAYKLTLGAGKQQSSLSFAILPELNLEAAQSWFHDATDITASNRDTALFDIEDMLQKILSLKPYEDGHALAESLTALADRMNRAKTGKSHSAEKMYDRGTPFRMAFRSKLDGSLQPYSVKLPADYDPARRYPLMVFLHGSGVGEEQVLDAPRSNGAFIEIAPLGRDKVNAYAFEQSAIDIEEAIDAAIRSFSVDEDSIILGGFSMGGYGALLTYYRNPDRFKAVAIFAGHPNLANQWLDTDAFPNFLAPRFLMPFKDTPVFLYHGTHDPALDINQAKALITALEKAGASITPAIVEGRGHVYQDTRTHTRYERWLETVLRK